MKNTKTEILKEAAMISMQLVNNQIKKAQGELNGNRYTINKLAKEQRVLKKSISVNYALKRKLEDAYGIKG